MLDAHRLRLLVELSRRGTLAAVAEELNYSSASVSQQLAALERDVGVPLLTKAGRGVQLTPAAEVLVSHAIEVLDRLEQAEIATTEAAGQAAGTVRVASFQSAMQTLMPTVLRSLAQTHPNLRVEVFEYPPERGLQALIARDVDLALAEQYPDRTRRPHLDLDQVPLATDALWFASARPAAGAIRATGGVLADSGSRTRDLSRNQATDAAADPLEALRGARDAAWVMEPRGTQSREWAEQTCRAAGFEPDVRYTTPDLVSQVHLITSGIAVGFLPELLFAGSKPPFAVTPPPGSPRREIFSSARVVTAESANIQAVRSALSDAAAFVLD